MMIMNISDLEQQNSLLTRKTKTYLFYARELIFTAISARRKFPIKKVCKKKNWNWLQFFLFSTNFIKLSHKF